jgi:hypothetical protein
MQYTRDPVWLRPTERRRHFSRKVCWADLHGPTSAARAGCIGRLVCDQEVTNSRFCAEDLSRAQGYDTVMVRREQQLWFGAQRAATLLWCAESSSYQGLKHMWQYVVGSLFSQFSQAQTKARLEFRDDINKNRSPLKPSSFSFSHCRYMIGAQESHLKSAKPQRLVIARSHQLRRPQVTSYGGQTHSPYSVTCTVTFRTSPQSFGQPLSE